MQRNFAARVDNHPNIMAPRSDPKDKAENLFNDDADADADAEANEQPAPEEEEEEELSAEDLAGTLCWPAARRNSV